MEIGERLKLEEIEEALIGFKMCPKCKSIQGFWLALKNDRPYVQCKECGTKFELLEVYRHGEKIETSEGLKFFRR